MQTIKRNTLKLAAALLMIMGLFGAGFSSSVAYAAPSCASTGSVSFNLWAKAGSATLYGSTSVTIWGYTEGATGATDAATLPNPVLTIDVGNDVTVNLTNNLSEDSALLFQGQDMIPDTTGAPANGGTKSYTFRACNPGTFLYEAGLGAQNLMSNTQHQVAMGMYGALIVRPATTGQAYDDASTAFNEENVLVLSELDPALNNSGTPATFDIRDYSPQYFLINGKAYPNTDPLTGNPGEKVLMRYINAGLQAHAMSTLGLSQTIIAQDGNPYTYSHNVVAETIATGQTLDTIVTVPASALAGNKFAVYDANLLLHNTNTIGLSFGGMLTFLTVGTGAPPPPLDPGPTVSNLNLSPNPTDGSVNVAVSATLTDGGTTPSNIHAAEFYIDGTANTPNAMSGSFDTATSISASGTINTIALASLSSGNHTIFVRGQDFNGNWGLFVSATLNLDKTGPATTGLGLNPNPSDGSVPVALTATGDDTASGNSNVTAAEYWVDAVGTPADGSGTLMTSSGSPAPIRAFTATIPAGLSQGSHIVSIHSQDVFGNWGTITTINLQVTDIVAPTTSNVVASPNPNNGSQPFNTSVLAVRVTADFSDVATGGSNIVAAEGFIDTIGTTGTGFVFIANDGNFNSPAESGYSDIPLPVVGALSNGSHTIYVHAKDAAGNWGANSTTILVINKPLYFSTLGNANPPGVSGGADNADIYLSNGSVFSRVINASGTGSLGLPGSANVDGFDRVDDTHFYMSFAGNTTVPGLGTVQDEDVVYYNNGVWSVYFDGTAQSLTANAQDLDAISISNGVLYFSTVGNGSIPGVSGPYDNADIYSWNGSSFARVWDATAANLPGSANVDGLAFVDAAHFYLSFSGITTNVPTLGAVEDVDVVYYDAGTWSVYFDGSAHGLTAGTNLDIDAFDLP